MSAPISSDGLATPDRGAFAAPERLHPAFLLSGLGRSFKAVSGGYALLAYLIVSGRLSTALLAAIAIATVSVIGVLLYWRNFEFRVGESDIRIDSGVLSRTHRSIPFNRIQDVDISQGPIARLFDVAKVRLDTGGSSGPKADEGVLQAIPLARAEELRELIRSRRTSGVQVPGDGVSAVTKEAAPVFAMSIGRLLLEGAFNFSLALFAGLIGLANTVGDVVGFDPFSREFWERLLSAGDPAREFILSHRVATALAGLVVLLLLGLLTGMVRTIIRDWGFRLDRTEIGLRRRRGLTTITDVTLPVRRVQAAIIASGPIRDAVGYGELKLQNLGHDEGSGAHVVAPVATFAETNTILGQLGWRELSGDVDWRPVSRAYVWTFMLGLAPFLIVAAIAQILFLPVLGLAWLTVPIALWFARWQEWKRIGYALDQDRLLLRSGWWQRRTTVLPLGRIQSVQLRESFVSRSFGIAALHFGVAGGTVLAAHSIPAIPSHDARILRDRLLGLVV
jgi:putative membrane protein